MALQAIPLAQTEDALGVIDFLSYVLLEAFPKTPSTFWTWFHSFPFSLSKIMRAPNPYVNHPYTIVINHPIPYGSSLQADT